MKLLVCGGRDYGDRERLFWFLDQLEPTAIVEGGARGADHLAGQYAGQRGLPHEVFMADWAKHGYGAGHKRNARMLREGKPDAVVAFPGGRGTADMVRRARVAGVPVIEVKAV